MQTIIFNDFLELRIYDNAKIHLVRLKSNYPELSDALLKNISYYELNIQSITYFDNVICVRIEEEDWVLKLFCDNLCKSIN
jgi:hypothetical protein